MVVLDTNTHLKFKIMKFDLARETDPAQISIAASELCSTLHLIGEYKDTQTEFWKWLEYAKQTQESLRLTEVELKRQIRELKKQLEESSK